VQTPLLAVVLSLQRIVGNIVVLLGSGNVTGCGHANL